MTGPRLLQQRLDARPQDHAGPGYPAWHPCRCRRRPIPRAQLAPDKSGTGPRSRPPADGPTSNARRWRRASEPWTDRCSRRLWASMSSSSASSGVRSSFVCMIVIRAPRRTLPSAGSTLPVFHQRLSQMQKGRRRMAPPFRNRNVICLEASVRRQERQRPPAYPLAALPSLPSCRDRPGYHRCRPEAAISPSNLSRSPCQRSRSFILSPSMAPPMA